VSPRIPPATLLPLTLSLLLGCALGDHYDSDTKGPAKPAVSSGAADESDSDTGSEASSEAGSEGDSVATWVTSESHSGGDTTSDSGDITTSPATGNPTSTTSSGPNTTSDDCGGPCDSPPNDCYDTIGECSDSVCLYYPLDSETACDDGDPCTDADVCDGFGACAGTVIECAAPHTSGGSCVDGACTGFACEEPWENCDGDWDNGCEIPTGIANQCDVNGLNPDGGCWTAYCGSLDDPAAFNFGDFYCYDCSTCHQAGENMVQWCNHDTGNWYPPENDKTCGMWLDLVCAPPP